MGTPKQLLTQVRPPNAPAPAPQLEETENLAIPEAPQARGGPCPRVCCLSSVPGLGRVALATQ